MNKTGNFKATVKEIDFVEHRFQNDNPGAMEIKVRFECEDGKGVTYLNLSPNYSESPKHAGMRNCDITKEMLLALDVNLDKNPKDLIKLKGQELDFYGKEGKNGDIYYYMSVYSDTKIEPKSAFDRIAGLFGDGANNTSSSTPPTAGAKVGKIPATTADVPDDWA